MTKSLPQHPGVVLREKYLAPLNMSAGALARACRAPRTRIERITTGAADITADTALRLAAALGTAPDLWLNLQNDYDLRITKRLIGKTVDKIERVTVAAYSTSIGVGRHVARQRSRNAPKCERISLSLSRHSIRL